MEQKNTPEKTFASGSIVATIWSNNKMNDGKAFEYKTVSLQRRYTDGSGNWKGTSSLRLNDLPKAELLLKEAYKYLVFKDKDRAA